MTDEEASAHVAEIYQELLAVEAQHPASRNVARLHGSLLRAFEAYKAAHPGVVQPWDGTSKPPPNP
jgi:hypothetical protein